MVKPQKAQELDEKGNPVKKERAPRGERAKKVPVKKEPKLLTIFYKLMKDKTREAQQPDTAAPEDDEAQSENKPVETQPGADQTETPKPVAEGAELIDTNVAEKHEASEGFTRSVQVTEKARVKQLTKQILEDLELNN